MSVLVVQRARSGTLTVGQRSRACTCWHINQLLPTEATYGSGNGSLGHHHLHELLVIDLPITVHICLSDHLIDLLIRELLTQVGHHMTQLSRADEAVAIAVENLEGLNQLFLS